MTDDLAPQNLLADVSRQQRRTRRLIDSNWFTFLVLGAALTVGGLVPDSWGWLFAGAMVAAYFAIALRWRHVAYAFAWRDGGFAVEWLPVGLGLAIGAGDWALSAQLGHTAGIVAVSLWTAVGCVLFWRLLHSGACLGLAVVAVGVGALQLLLGTNDTVLYGAAFLLWGAGYWLWLGRRTR
jgi:hypothetical protein